MIETVTTYNTFYPLLFFTIVIILGLIVFCFFKIKDTNIFFRHSEEHEDTTDKMKDMHNTVAKATFTVAHEQELHRIECMLIQMSEQLSNLTQRIIYLEQNKD